MNCYKNFLPPKPLGIPNRGKEDHVAETSPPIPEHPARMGTEFPHSIRITGLFAVGGESG